jgi:hypothetical protein
VSVSRLATILTRRSPVRISMMVLLVATSLVVFVLVTDLSRVSQEGLDAAITREHGLADTYRVRIASELGWGATQASRVVDEVAASFGADVGRRYIDLPPTASECPPFDLVGELSLRVMWEPDGRAAELPYGTSDEVDTEWCIAGARIPDAAIFFATPAERMLYGEQVFLHPAYYDVVYHATYEPVTLGWLVVAPNSIDIQDELNDAFVARADDEAERSGRSAVDLVQVVRAFDDAVGIRTASDGIATVYNVIRWGVLALAGLALAGLEIVIAQQRAWLFGLAAAFGATRARIAAFLAVEIALVVGAGTALGVGFLAVAQGTIVTFARDAFQVVADPLALENLVMALLGMTTVVISVTCTAAVGVLRRDPLEVLEAARD